MQENSRLITLVGILVILLFHANSFFVSHVEGDEIVYLELSRAMRWDFSNYTTMKIPVVNNFARAIYRAPLFLHPPLYPFLLKCLAKISPTHLVHLAMVLGTLVHLGMFFLLMAGCRWLRMNESSRLLVGLLVVFCPVLGFSTSRVHIDGLLALLGTGSIIFFIRANMLQSNRLYLLAGIFGGLALNTKITALIYIPVFLLLCFFSYIKTPADAKRLWIKRVLLFLGPIFVIGMPHYLNLLLTYHTLIPTQLMNIDRPLNLFQQSVLKRTPNHMILYQFLIYPIIIILLMPSFWKLCLGWKKNLSWYFVLAVIFLLLYSTFTFVSFDQERYWAPFLPLLFILFSAFISDCGVAQKPSLALLVFLSLLFMFSAGFIVNCLYPNMCKITPGIFYWITPFKDFYL